MPLPEHRVPPVAKGDQWDGLPSLQRQVDGGNPANPLSSVRIHLRSKMDLDAAAAVKDISSSVVITNATTWAFRIDPVVLDIPAAEYYADIETTDSAGVVHTLCRLIIPVEKSSTF